MTPEPARDAIASLTNQLGPASRALLDELSRLLLDQHKLLLELEKARYEETNGPVGGPGNFLNLLLGDPQFAWLRQISGLVVDIDEALSRRSKAVETDAAALLVRVRETMAPREDGDDFQTRYYAAVQASPDVVILQVRIERLLGLQ
jgi:hypothetical protein